MTFPDFDPVYEQSLIGGDYRIGRVEESAGYHDYRIAFQWEFPASLGAGAYIRKVTLYFTYYTQSGQTIEQDFEKFSHGIFDLSTEQTLSSIVYRFGTEIDRKGGAFHTYTNQLNGNSGTYLYTVERFPAVMQDPTELLTQIQLGANNDERRLHLAFCPYNDHPPKSWLINPESVRLRIEYDPAPSALIDSIFITNVVDGQEDYRSEAASRVRGDLNVFLPNSWDADYGQLPPFEPPPAERVWSTNYRHIAETWFAKFEDPSLSGRHKHKFWQENLDNYSVIHRTDIYELGDDRIFEAHTDQAYQARHLAKRELFYDYDGLPIEFKDPWRVLQTMPMADSMQMSLNYHVDQVTPYEPWNDAQSWGVFVDIPTNKEPHYRAKYWKYYEYHADSDGYSKKDNLPLAEGDLINMDLILSGAGTQVFPSGSIETSPAEQESDPFKDYKLKYLNLASTMDLTGIYKAHLLSDSEAQPTRNANQRKIDISEQDIYTRVYHLVYESAGEVWYTQSSDNGDTWSPEELVSGYQHTASNPSLYALQEDVYVVFMEGDVVRLRQRHEGGWYDHPLYDDLNNNGATSTPVVAAGFFCQDPDGIARDHVVAVLWDENENLRYNLLRIEGTTVAQDQNYGDLQRSGVAATNSVSYPLSPSIVSDHDFIYFSASWREGDAVKAARLEIPSCNPVAFDLYTLLRPDVSSPSEKAVFAPCITHNADNKPVVAYEVRVPSQVYSDRWVNVKTYDQSSQLWNTTVYHIPYYSRTGYGQPIAPSVGAHSTSGQPGLRVAFHPNWGGGVRVVVVDASIAQYTQLDNGESFPSVVPYASNAALREAYSYPYPTAPFQHAVRTTNDNLTKSTNIALRMVRDLRVCSGDDLSVLGITDMTLVRQDSSRSTIEWMELSDTLVIGQDLLAHELLRSEEFTPSNGATLEYSGMVYCSDPTAMPSGVSLTAHLRRASDDAVLLSQSLPLRQLPGDTAIWHAWSRNLSQLPAVPVYLSLGVDGSMPSGVTLGTSKVFLEAQHIPKRAIREEVPPLRPAAFTLEQNHPNPFNPVTSIPFTLRYEQHVRLAVFDLLGREIAVLVDGVLPEGRHERRFDAGQLPAGVYQYQLTAEGASESRTLTLVK
ncbi:MAG TPA: hypothetical protein PK916_05315 [Bacteroidota bacterium]|nr:hypothetical protein [Bacteroidota bacterium]